MQSRLVQIFLAELIAMAALVFGGLALVGAGVTWTGDSRLSTSISWALVAVFGFLALLLGKAAATRLRNAFVRTT